MSQYFAIVDRPDEEPRRHYVMVASRLASRDGNIERGEVVAPMLKPTPLGLYVLDERDPWYNDQVAALKDKMERENIPGEAPRLVGPFKTDEEAYAAVLKVRPKTESEKEYDRGLAMGKELAAKEGDAEKAALLARIADLESNTKKT